MKSIGKLIRVVTQTALWSLGLVLGSVLFAQSSDRSAHRVNRAAESPTINPTVFANLEFRNLGPGIMGGRLTDIEGVPGNPNLLYVASASGGLWKTVNGGIRWTSIFDRQNTLSIGDIAVDPKNPDVIWVGTGEDNPRNSVSYGDGVYRSTDGGNTWEHLGLSDTERISRILLHPSIPGVAYVAAIGHVSGSNEERGVFMTVDGGKTWQKTLYTDAEHGASDLEMDPSNPNILYAGMWHFWRRPWRFESGDEGGGLYKSIDGGRTWKKLTNGLPKLTGRIGVKVAPSRPNIVYVVIESREGSLYRSEDRGETFKTTYKDRILVPRGFYFAELRVDPRDENRVYVLSGPLLLSIDGGKTFRRIAPNQHGDFHTGWIDPTTPDRVWMGNDGGLAVSLDRAENWEYMNIMPLGQFYQIAADNREPFYYVCGGTQDSGTWCGPSRTRHSTVIPNDFWNLISYGDAFHVATHPKIRDLYVTTYHAGGLLRTDLDVAEQQDVNPYTRRNEGGPVSALKYRYNWNTPLVPSPHDGTTLYLGANVVFKSTDFGTVWQKISPDLTTNDPEKQKNSGGPVYFDNHYTYHCTITSLAESPAQRGILWAGTDDGNIQVSANGGESWSNVRNNIARVPAYAPVTHIEASRTNAGTAYVSLDRHDFDDFQPYIFKTTDLGKTWVNITGNLPQSGYVHVVREDPRNTKVLYVGTELGLFISLTGGQNWLPLKLQNLPPVAVTDIVIHPRDNDLILGTHGRGIWVFDDATLLQQIDEQVLQRPLFLFELRPTLRFSRMRVRPHYGDKAFRAPNPPYGALISYYLKDKMAETAELRIEIRDQTGKVIRELKQLPREKGINRVTWDLRHEPPPPRPTSHENMPGFRFWQSYSRWADPFDGEPSPQVLPGTYSINLISGDSTATRPVEVRLDPTVKVSLEELRAQHQLSLKLRTMAERITGTIRKLWIADEQIKELQTTLLSADMKPSPETKAALDDARKRIAALDEDITFEANIRRDGPAATFGKGPRLLEHVNDLLRRIELVNATPTQYQLEFFAELQREYDDKVTAADRFLSESVPALNRLLQTSGISSGITVGKVD